MTATPIHSSQPDRWTSPRPYSDASIRLMKYGRVRPMVEPSFLARLFGRR